jgi:hypothetical protein
MDNIKHCSRFLLNNFPIFAVFFLYISVYKIYLSMNAHTLHPSEINDKLTIRLEQANFPQFVFEITFLEQTQYV